MKKKENIMYVKKTSDVAVGDTVVIIRTFGQEATDVAVTEVQRITATQIVVRRPVLSLYADKGNKLRYKESTYGGYVDPVGERSSSYSRKSNRYEYTTLRLVGKKEDIEATKKAIADKEAAAARTAKAAATKKKNEQDKAAAEHRKKMEGYWQYEGKKLWEEAEEVKTAQGVAKVLCFQNNSGFHRGPSTAFVIARQTKDNFAWNEDDKDKLYWEATISGFNTTDDGRGNMGANSWSTSINKAADLIELVYRIVH